MNTRYAFAVKTSHATYMGRTLHFVTMGGGAIPTPCVLPIGFICPVNDSPLNAALVSDEFLRAVFFLILPGFPEQSEGLRIREDVRQVVGSAVVRGYDLLQSEPYRKHDRADADNRASHQD